VISRMGPPKSKMKKRNKIGQIKNNAPAMPKSSLSFCKRFFIDLHPDVPVADFHHESCSPGISANSIPVIAGILAHPTTEDGNFGESPYRLAGQDCMVEHAAELGAQEVFLPKLFSELQTWRSG
ncbi:MAG: hypothetical protein AAF394_10275, partial [Planctomycetota bacterium]